MILIMKNDYVTIYDMTINDYESMKSLASALKQYEIYKVLKNDFSSELLKSELGDSSELIRCYYYDTGIKLERKDISDISEIKYYEDEIGRLWPSMEYYKMTERKISIDPVIAKLLGRDYELNQANHILNLLTLEQIEEFKKYYDGLYINSSNEINGIELTGKGYNVNYYCKLILKDKIDKITSGKLNDCVFLIVIPAGYNTDNEMKYFVHPYKITKSDTDDISTIYKQILNKDGLKVSELTNEGKIIYLEKAVKQYLQTVFYENISSIQIGGTSYTWEEYKRIFEKEYKMNLSEFSLKWEIFDKILVDSRKVVNGNITPLITEYNNLSNKDLVSDESLSDDNELPIKIHDNGILFPPDDEESEAENELLNGSHTDPGMTVDELLKISSNYHVDSLNSGSTIDGNNNNNNISLSSENVIPVMGEPIVDEENRDNENDLGIFGESNNIQQGEDIDPFADMITIDPQQEISPVEEEDPFADMITIDPQQEITPVEEEDPFADMITIDPQEKISPVEDEDPFADMITVDPDEKITAVKDEDPFADMITIDSDEDITPVEDNDYARSSGLATLNLDTHDFDVILDRLATYEYRDNQEFPNNWANTPKRK